MLSKITENGVSGIESLCTKLTFITLVPSPIHSLSSRQLTKSASAMTKTDESSLLILKTATNIGASHMYDIMDFKCAW